MTGDAKSSGWRRLLRRFHPEGIPWPGSCFYNLISRTSIFQSHYRLLADDIGEHCSCGRILDIGTGPAWLPITLCRALPEVQVVGVDISEAMVAKARENVRRASLEHRITMHQAGAALLPFPDDSFDLVVSTGTLHHWKEASAGLNEAYRVLKPGHAALMYDLVQQLPPDVADRLRREFGRYRMTILWLHSFEEPFYIADQMQQLASDSWFGRGETRYVGALCCLEMIKPHI